MPTGQEKLGKKAAKIDSRTLKFAKYLTDKIGPVKPSVDYTTGIKNFGMMLNGPNSYGPPVPPDGLGICTIAACGHAEQVWSAVSRHWEQTPPDRTILSKYELWCGYVAGDPSTDNGGTEIDVLNHWRRTQLDYHPLKMYADPDPRNLDHVRKAIELLGGIYIGVQLPISVQGKSVWDAASGPDGVPGSWGGHAVWVPNYVTNLDGTVTLIAISWGELVEITPAFWNSVDPHSGPYVDEAHALVAQEFTNLATGLSPQGIDIQKMEADALLVTG